jgi:hypothetical protein
MTGPATFLDRLERSRLLSAHDMADVRREVDTSGPLLSPSEPPDAQFAGGRDRQAPLALQDGVEGFSFDVFHDQEMPILRLVGVEGGDEKEERFAGQKLARLPSRQESAIDKALCQGGAEN